MKPLLIILFFISILSCNNNKGEKATDKYNGIWKQTEQKRIAGDPNIDSAYQKQFNNPDQYLKENLYETYLLINSKGSNLDIQFDVTDQAAKEKCDNVLIKGDSLSFRKKNVNDTYNYYTLSLDSLNTCNGTMKSYNGNTYQITYQRMPAGYKIKHNPIAP